MTALEESLTNVTILSDMHLTVRRYTDIAGMSAILVVTVGLLAGRRHQLAQAVEFGTRFS